MAGAVSSKPKVAQKPVRKGPSKLTKTYLLAYNVVQTLGWSYLLYQLVSHYLPGNTKPLWDTVWWTVMIFQNAAVLEIVHAAAGMVQSSIMTTLLQVYSRVFLVCAVLLTSRGAVESAGLPLSLFAWCVTEIVRYSFYAFNLLGSVPYILQYLRYTLFYALYPIGITGELWCMYVQQNEVATSGMWSYAMPNRFNFIFNYRYFLIAYMLSYVPIFPLLFMHMMNQRKKVLGGGDKKTK